MLDTFGPLNASLNKLRSRLSSSHVSTSATTAKLTPLRMVESIRLNVALTTMEVTFLRLAQKQPSNHAWTYATILLTVLMYRGSGALAISKISSLHFLNSAMYGQVAETTPRNLRPLQRTWVLPNRNLVDRIVLAKRSTSESQTPTPTNISAGS
jgi:hypothetical protein